MTKAGDLTYSANPLGDQFVEITVAGQCRTCTGFAFQPSHPGVEAPWPDSIVVEFYDRPVALSRDSDLVIVPDLVTRGITKGRQDEQED